MTGIAASPRKGSLAVVLVCLVLGLSACASPAEPLAEPSDGGAATLLEVSCSPDGVAVSAETVQASADGVHLQVSSTAPTGTYLNFGWPGGGGGEEAPSAGATTWTRAVPPGELTLACMTGGDLGPATVVTVTDPNDHWSTTTLADLGCSPGGWPLWVLGPASGPTALDAVASLAAAFVDHRGDGVEGGPPEVVRALVGYTGSPEEVWLISAQDGSHVTAKVSPDGTGFTADLEMLCG